MQMTIRAAAAVLAFTALASATLKPITGDLEVTDRKSVVVFKTTAEGELSINLYFPEGWKAADRRPGIVFFFGGGFVGGSPKQFTSKAEYLAGRGMVAATAEYRVKSRHNTEPEKSIEDAKSAIRWMRGNAGKLGLDPRRIVAAGGSAGGTCAAFAAFNTTYEPEGEDISVSSRPEALVLYNPALGAGENTVTRWSGEKRERMVRFLSAWKAEPKGPPAILFFGTDDALLAPARIFVQQLAAAGNKVELYTAAGQKHGFFNDREGSPWHAHCLHQTDLFLAGLGYLKGRPTIQPLAGFSLQKESL
jgi:acetyl esterase/lipase